MSEAAFSEILSRLDWIETALAEGVCPGHATINTAFTHVYTMAMGDARIAEKFNALLGCCP